MKRRILQFLNTDLFKASFLNGIANLLKILSGLVSNKIVAVYLGPSGVALLGQFNNFVNIVMSLANLGINQGITKYTAEYATQNINRNRILSTGFYLIISSAIIASLAVLIGKNYFSDVILHTRNYSSIFIVLAFTITLFVLNSFLVAVLNGFKEFKRIVITNIISSTFGLAISIFCVIKYGVYGAFLGHILSQTIIFIVTLLWVIRSDWFTVETFTRFFHKPEIVKLGRYALMAFTTLFATSFVQLQIRTYIIEHISMSDAGYWQGIIRICDLYIMFVTTTLGIYYLPRLSEIRTNGELRKEIFRGYKFILPLVILSSALIFILKDLIINILFSSSFSSMRNLFLFQLMGNVLKISSWLLSYMMIAKAMTKIYILSEIMYGIVYYSLTIFAINKFGVIGATYSYCIVYLLYLIFILIVFRKLITGKSAKDHR